MSESLRNDGRIWVPKQKGDNRKPNEIPEEERDYYLEEDILHLETLFQEMWLQEQLKKDVMLVME
jgi:hypothetical protein